MTGINIGDIGKLGVRNVQQLRKLQSVCGCLIEHNNELGVCQHRSCRVGLKQVVHILRDARGISAVLSHTLPKGEQEVCTVFVLEQKVDLIDKDEGMEELELEPEKAMALLRSPCPLSDVFDEFKDREVEHIRIQKTPYFL